ncbi:MAG: iron-sulfur cluster repair di-iron protein [Acidobacteriota bacterium]
MENLDLTHTVGSVVARRPELSRIFENAGIDYCCGGKKSLLEACREKGLDPEELVAQLRRAAEASPPPAVSPAQMSLAELADHIEKTHHAYLRSELPRLDALTEKVARVHGSREPRLEELRGAFLSLAQELFSHMMKEEQILFPMIRQLEAADVAPRFHCGSLSNPIAQMEFEHDNAAALLERQRSLTGGFVPPEWACNTYRAMLDALARLEKDMHEHIHKENNVLFPRAQAMEIEKRRT